MWQRIKRVFRSAFGSAIEAMESPEMILRQNIRDLEDQVPRMNESIATVRANQRLLERELEKLERTERELTSKIKASLKAGRRDIGVSFATQLEQVRTDKASTEEQLVSAKKAYEQAIQVRDAFMREKDKKVKEAQRALASAKRAEWQSKVADTMETFQVGGINQSHDEMLSRLEQKTATNEARLEMALESQDTATFEIEEEARKLEANDTLRQFELEMGLAQPDAPEAPEPAPRKQIGGVSE